MSVMMLELGVAIDGGKDSLSMAAQAPDEAELVRCPGELVVSVYATMADVRCKVTPDLKGPAGETVLFLARITDDARESGYESPAECTAA